MSDWPTMPRGDEGMPPGVSVRDIELAMEAGAKNTGTNTGDSREWLPFDSDCPRCGGKAEVRTDTGEENLACDGDKVRCQACRLGGVVLCDEEPHAIVQWDEPMKRHYHDTPTIREMLDAADESRTVNAPALVAALRTACNALEWYDSGHGPESRLSDNGEHAQLTLESITRSLWATAPRELWFEGRRGLGCGDNATPKEATDNAESSD